MHEFAKTIIEPGASVDESAHLGCFVQVQNGAYIGADAVIAGHTTVPAHVHIDANAYIGHGVSFATSAVLSPLHTKTKTLIGKGVHVGNNAVIGEGISIGAGSIISPLTIIQKSIPSMAIVEGLPARIIGYVGASQALDLLNRPGEELIQAHRVRGVKLLRMKNVIDIRGNLTVGEFDRDIPFQTKRYFIVYDVPSMETRGEHAHHECHQLLICVRGSCAVVADDGFQRHEFSLNRPDVGLYLPPLIWGIQYKYSSDAVLLVFASRLYEAEDYIRNYVEFVEVARSKAQQ